jgi:hypothetical protein
LNEVGSIGSEHALESACRPGNWRPHRRALLWGSERNLLTFAEKLARCSSIKRQPIDFGKEDDCLGTLRITGVSRTFQVPSPGPDPHRCPWERFAPRQSFARVSEIVPVLACLTRFPWPTTAALIRWRGRQYSSANMIVITRSVTVGSDGSGEW